MDLWIFIQKNIFLVAVTLVSGGMLIWPLISRLMSPGKAVSALEAVQLINRRDAIVLDVRDAVEFAAGHIPNARHFPLNQLDERVKEIDKFKSRPIVVSCRSGNRSASAVALLGRHGFAEVFSLRGGLIAWEQASMPLAKG